MYSKVYKWCSVPLCRNTSKATPHKLFAHVPTKKILRDKWFKLAWRNPADVTLNSHLYFCEDHFDLPNDMQNYMQYHVMGSVSQVRMKKGCVPKKFDCQPDRKMQTSDTIEQRYLCKKRNIAPQKCKKELEEHFEIQEIAFRSSDTKKIKQEPEEKQPYDYEVPLDLYEGHQVKVEMVIGPTVFTQPPF